MQSLFSAMAFILRRSSPSRFLLHQIEQKDIAVDQSSSDLVISEDTVDFELLTREDTIDFMCLSRPSISEFAGYGWGMHAAMARLFALCWPSLRK